MKGFTLVELLIALLVSMLVLGAVLVLVLPVQGLTQAQLETADLQQRLRVAVRRISADVVGAVEILPFRAGAAGDDRVSGIFFRPGVITARANGQSHAYYLRFDPVTGANQLMHYDGGGGDFPLVDHVLSLAFTYVGDARGSTCSGLTGDASTLTSLDPLTLSDGPWCPVDTSATRVDADIFRIRRVSGRLRLQVAHASLRGMPGVLFQNGGTARAPGRYVPDLEIRFDMAPRTFSLP